MSRSRGVYIDLALHDLPSYTDSADTFSLAVSGPQLYALPTLWRCATAMQISTENQPQATSPDALGHFEVVNILATRLDRAADPHQSQPVFCLIAQGDALTVAALCIQVLVAVP